MAQNRSFERVITGNQTTDGAGVRLYRVFGHDQTTRLDPFLMLDDIHSSDPDDYLAGFPEHPHRGMETVTYMISGSITHRDNLGNKGIIRSGDVQWMTAGSGIIHQEMPQRYEGMLQGFQLWVNLPRKDKMMPPRYREVPSETIPKVKLADDVEVRIIAGKLKDVQGPVRDIVVPVDYFDVSMPKGSRFIHRLQRGRNAFAYVFSGSVSDGGGSTARSGQMAIIETGEEARFEADQSGARFLLVSGEPIREPIAWGGPVVMNTREELDEAFREIENGTFVKT
jgi:redox-sensitive bicupin YhaK (pirin superfamily)